MPRVLKSTSINLKRQSSKLSSNWLDSALANSSSMNALQTVSALTATLLTRPANASLYTFSFNENIDNYSDCAKRGNPFIDNKDFIT